MEPEGTKGWLTEFLITEAATRVLDFGRVNSNDLRQVWEISLKRLLWASLLLALWTSHPRLSVIEAMKAGLLLFLDPGPPRKPSWGLAMVEYIWQCGRKVRGLEYLYLLRPGPCWSDEDPKMEREGNHVERNLQRRCTDEEEPAHGRIKCDPKTSILSHGERWLNPIIKWQLLCLWNLLSWTHCCSGLRQRALGSDLKMTFRTQWAQVSPNTTEQTPGLWV